MNKGFLAEKAGFEPAVRFEPYTRFPGVHLKPLGHFSNQFSRNVIKMLIICVTFEAIRIAL